MLDMPCHCGSQQLLSACCAPYIHGVALPPTASLLMRSRYSAFVLQKADYLLSTWHSSHRPAHIQFEPHQKWLGLKIKQTRLGDEQHDTGHVEFVAKYKVGGARAERLHEVSEFVKEQGRWYYLQGQILA